MERGVTVALAQPGRKPSSLGLWGPWHTLRSQVPMSRDTTLVAPGHRVVPVCWAGSLWHWLYSLPTSPSEQGSSPSEVKDELLAEWDDSEGGQLLPGDSERSCSFTSRLSITFSFSWSSRLSLWRWSNTRSDLHPTALSCMMPHMPCPTSSHKAAQRYRVPMGLPIPRAEAAQGHPPEAETPRAPT